MGYGKIDKSIAKLYLLFMPVVMLVPFNFVNRIFVGLANRTSFLFFLAGIVLILFRGSIMFYKDESTRLLRKFSSMYLIGDITSIVMALIMYNELGRIGGESTLSAIIPKIAYSLFYIALIYYNREVFGMLTTDKISRIFDIVIDISIIIGLLQMAVLFFGGPFSAVYNIFNRLLGAWNSTNIRLTGRIALLTTEPASIANYICILLIPHIFAKGVCKGFGMRDIIRLFMILVVLYFTKSTTGYTLFLLDFGIFFISLLGKNGINRKIKRVALIIVVLVAVFGLAVIIRNPEIMSSTGKVFDKLLNDDNTSAMTRKANLQIDWEIFKHYPIAGVGNGNQGFFYRRFFPEAAKQSLWALERYNTAAYVLYDGGVFFGALISGYGIIGTVLFGAFLLSGFFTMRRNREKLGYFYYLYIFGFFSMIIASFGSTMVGDYSFWFMLSLPLSVAYVNETNGINGTGA